MNAKDLRTVKNLFGHIPEVFTMTPSKSNVREDVGQDCLIIQVCQKLDLSVVGNFIEIPFPSGYICDCRTEEGHAKLSLETYDAETEWTQTATVKFSTMNVQSGSEYEKTVEISHNNNSVITFMPFVKDYIRLEVMTEAIGVNPCAMVSCVVYCRK